MKIRWFATALLVISMAWLSFDKATKKVEKQPFDPKFRAWESVLDTYVDHGMVNYQALKKNPTQLIQTLQEAASVSKAKFTHWGTEEQLAFLINLYNAATMKLVVDNYPITSIREVGRPFGSPWKIEFISLFDTSVSLDHIEHEMIRKFYNIPEVHFALVCASKSCPELKKSPFLAKTLQEDLHEAGEIFLNDPLKNRIDRANKTLFLSSIFKWYESDFIKKSPTIVEYVTPFFNQSDQAALKKGAWKIEYLPYDWNLNDSCIPNEKDNN